MPRLGEIVPNFTADSTAGNIDFHTWLGDSWAILFSHPADYTPVCTTELGRVQALNQEFAARCPGVTNERGGCGSAGFADGALSAEACQAICQATRDCKFFSYHVDRPDKRCRLCKDDTRGGKCSSSAERAADATLHE